MNRNRASRPKETDFAEENGSLRKRAKRGAFQDLGTNFNVYDSSARRYEQPRKQSLRATTTSTSHLGVQSSHWATTTVAPSQYSLHYVPATEDPMDCDMVDDFYCGITNSSLAIDPVEDLSIFECGEIRKEIIENLRRKEARYHAHKNPRPMHQFQTDITSNMRGILLDWLVEVAEEYSLTQQTLFLAANYVDRFLSKVQVSRNSLQLVGIACMMLAAKYEEIYPPSVEEFAAISDNTYNRKQILEMEQTVLRQLDFRLTAPTSFDFIAPFLRAATGAPVLRGDKLYLLTNMLAELTLPEYSFWNYLPSQVAAAAVCLAHYTIGRDLPNRAGFEAFTKYSVDDLQHTITELWELHKRAPSADCRAVLAKYAKPDKYQGVSCIFPSPYSLGPFFHK